jgi:hypothetical protein
MPLHPIQREIARLLAANRSPESHPAGGAGLHREENSLRYSQDLDYFNDREELVATAFAHDQSSLRSAGYAVNIDLNQPGYIRAMVSRAGTATKIEWAYESAFRFMPPLSDPEVGYVLHPLDLAINKVHALAGRDEARDYLDVLHLDRHLLSLGALCWAAVGKDPGYSPLGLVEQLARKGRFRAEDFADLDLTVSIDLTGWKTQWLAALAQARSLVQFLPPTEAGCLYLDPATKNFITPAGDTTGYVKQFGSLGGVLPLMLRT